MNSPNFEGWRALLDRRVDHNPSSQNNNLYLVNRENQMRRGSVGNLMAVAQDEETGIEAYRKTENTEDTYYQQSYFLCQVFFNLQTFRARPMRTRITMPRPRHWTTFAGLWPIFPWQTRPERGWVTLRQLQLPASHWHKEWCRTGGLCWDTAVIRDPSLTETFIQYVGRHPKTEEMSAHLPGINGPSAGKKHGHFAGRVYTP